MDIFDFLFPEQSQAESLKTLNRNLSNLARSTERASDKNSKTLALILLSLIKSLIDKGVISEEELIECI
jgi:hypothetical protein